ncbi:MAG: hypothetical protein GX059_08100 [Clostridiales bacterium]|nr:hypothetical protein [Clostridiales bacterium]
MLLIPAWFVTGVLAVTWPVYLVALAFSNAGEPLLIGNLVVMPIALLFVIYAYIRLVIMKRGPGYRLLCNDKKTAVMEALIVFLVSVLATVLMWTTFYARDGRLNIGVSVFSDFSPHIGMIRSFSYGNNFPTSYSHYAGEDIKYHFMFQFLAGNLEFLGLRIDYAFNLPSMLSFISAFMLLYVLAVKITGRMLTGGLALWFFAFRSGKALFEYISEIPKGVSIWETLAINTDFIGKTTHEDWGLWNLNVYCNQRHFAFGLSVMFFLIIMFLPHLYEMIDALQRKKGFSNKTRHIFFSGQGWKIGNVRYPVFLGILLGSLAFFHGSAVIGCLLVLFVIAILATRRLEFLITAVITVLLSTLQSSCFINGTAVKPEFLFGFIAQNKTLFGVLSYLDRLLGVLIPVIIIAFIFGDTVHRFLITAFAAQLIFAFTVSLTVDVTVNHKYVMMSCILLGIFSALLVTRMLESRKAAVGIAAAALIIMLSATGIYDFTTVIRKNSRIGPIVLNMDDPLTEFVINNSDSRDIFLTGAYSINQVVFGGAMLYQGHQYYAWSAGYDTYYRDIMVRRMFEAQTPEELDELVKENNISFIIIDSVSRESDDYILNEDNIRATYECVYEAGEGYSNVAVFDTSKRIY